MFKPKPISESSFKKALNNYCNDCRTIDNPSFDKLKAEESFTALCDTFKNLMYPAYQNADIKENISLYCTEQKDIIPQVGFVTSKSNIEITFGLFRDFYFMTPLVNTNKLASMPDEFWALILRLESLGKIEFRENYKPSRQIKKTYPQFFKKQDTIFKINRVYFLKQIEFGNSNNLGYLLIKWDSETDLKTLISNVQEAFVILYKINHLLWKSTKSR